MKQKVLLFTAFAGITYLTLTGSKMGPGAAGQGNKTGGPGSAGQTCAMAGCHNSGIGTTNASIEIRKRFKPDSNAIVNSYLPDSLYTVKLSASHSTLSYFGVQLMAVKFSDSTNAGIISGYGAKFHTIDIGGKNLLESIDTLYRTGSGSSSTYEMSFVWKAPPKNSGQVRFYAAVLAANGDGTATGDQSSSSASIALAEALSINTPRDNISFSVYPNLIADVINIRLSSARNGTYHIMIYNLCGQQLYNKDIAVNNNELREPINTQQWTPGLYYVQLSKESERQIIPVVKY